MMEEEHEAGGQGEAGPAEEAPQGAPPAETGDKTSIGLEPNLAALIAYVLGWVSGLIIFLVEKDNKYVRFHALQSILFNVAIIVAYIGIGIVFAILSALPGLGIVFVIVGPLLWGLLSLGIFVLWIVLMIRAYQGEKLKLPVIGDIAEENS